MKILAVYLALVAAWWLMVFKLVQFGHVKTLLVLIALFAVQCPCASAQSTDAPDGTSVASAVVSGVDAERVSPGLRRDIDALVGMPLNASDVDALAKRLEAEQLDSVVATRRVLTDDGKARVIFLVALNEAGGKAGSENVNARYVVESVAVEGVPESRLSQTLRDDLHAVVGTRLDRADAEHLEKRVRDEFPGYDVTRRMSRGLERGRVRMILNIQPGESMRWLHFEPSRSKFLYHSDQGWSGVLDLNIGRRDWRVSPFFAMSNADDLVEEYSGIGFRVEARNAGTEELGVGFELATYEATWRDATRAALLSSPSAPLAYHTRTTVAPSLSLAFSPHFHVTGGVSVTQLEPDEHMAGPDQSANAYVLTFGYDNRWERAARQEIRATFSLRAASATLQSDLDYERYLGRADYRVRWGHNMLLASGMGGGLTGPAPLFERFTLGDTTTLRGWDKYDIAPAGGDRVSHGSVEYSHRWFAFFLDGGSVWDTSEQARARFSTGFGFHHENVFVTLGFPLNTPDVRTTFMIGVRF